MTAAAAAMLLLGAGPPAAPAGPLGVYARLDALGTELIVRAVAFSPDGRSLAVAADGGAGAEPPPLSVWEAATVRPRAASGPGGPTDVSSLAFLPGRRLFVGTPEPLVCGLPSFEAAGAVPRLRFQDWGLAGSAASPDGRRAVVLPAGRPPAVWDLAARRREGPLVGHKGGLDVLAAAFSPDGRTIATAGTDRAVMLWDAATRRRLAAFPGGDEPVGVLAFDPSGRHLAAAPVAYRGRTVRVIDVRAGREVLELKADAEVTALAFSPDGAVLAAGLVIDDRRGNVRGALGFWSVPRGGPGRSAAAGVPSPSCLAYSSDGSLLAVGGLGGPPELLRMPSPGPPAAGGRRPALPAAAKVVEGMWERLADDDAKKGDETVIALAARPAEAARLLAARLGPVRRAHPGAVAALVKDLDAEDFARRDAAEAGLKRLGEGAWPALREVRDGAGPLELRLRAGRLVGADGPLSRAESVREVRAVEALERAGGGDAKAVLRWLAGGDPEARLTREARWALRRLGP